MACRLPAGVLSTAQVVATGFAAGFCKHSGSVLCNMLFCLSKSISVRNCVFFPLQTSQECFPFAGSSTGRGSLSPSSDVRPFRDLQIFSLELMLLKVNEGGSRCDFGSRAVGCSLVLFSHQVPMYFPKVLGQQMVESL